MAAPTKALRSLTLIPLPHPGTGEHVSGVTVAGLESHTVARIIAIHAGPLG
jgi:hypothetical protein